MNDINYEDLLRLYEQVSTAEREDPISEVVCEDGMIHYYTKSGKWAGCSSVEAFNKMREKAQRAFKGEAHGTDR